MQHLTKAILTLTLATSAFAAGPVPRPAKEFTFVEPSGKQTLLSSYKGKVVVIQFLYTTCPHCQNTSKELTTMMSQVPGVQILGCAFEDEDNAATVSAYVRQYHVGFPVAFAKRDTVTSFLGLSVMERLAVPQMVIVDKKGVIRRQSDPLGTAELQMPSTLLPMLRGYMGEGAAGSVAPAGKNGGIVEDKRQSKPAEAPNGPVKKTT